MWRSIIGLMFLIIVALGATTVVAAECNKPCAASSQAQAHRCEPSSPSSAVSREHSRGKLTGRFDPAMSGVCRFACATKLMYQSRDVQAQPGARAGRLTQCPVSGVVFAVDGSRPRVRIGSDEYVTCCDRCATKLKRDRRRYLRV